MGYASCWDYGGVVYYDGAIAGITSVRRPVWGEEEGKLKEVRLLRIEPWMERISGGGSCVEE